MLRFVVHSTLACETEVIPHSSFGSDWSQFVPTLIATFAGFILAIVASFIYDSIRDKNDQGQLIIHLKDELEDVALEIQRISGDMRKENETILWVDPLKVYIWDATTSNNKLSLISSKVWYKDLLSIYHSIKEYNSWELLRTNAILLGLEYEDIENSLYATGDEITEKINAILQQMDVK